jgi:hypothetical protein
LGGGGESSGLALRLLACESLRGSL